MSYTIVAIPTKDDYVWKISSEKVPHMTLLSLGDTLQNESRVLDFLAHVVETSAYRTGVEVTRRGTLGPQEADVLFFEGYGLRCFNDTRANLLKNKDLFEAYISSDQYESWTPHLTLGYPATPAKPDPRDYPGIGWINFDKIALWTGDYEGPEFILKERNALSDDTIAYSSMLSDETFAHFGVKGMQWGKRKSLPLPTGMTRGQHYYNQKQHGRSGAERIKAGVAAGSDLKTARNAELDRGVRNARLALAGSLALYGAVKFGPEIAKYTMRALESAAARKVATAGAKAAAEAFSNSRGISSSATINLAFNGAKGLWE